MPFRNKKRLPKYKTTHKFPLPKAKNRKIFRPLPNPIKQAAKPRLSGTAAPIISRRLPKIIQKVLDASCGGAQQCYNGGGYSCYE